VLLTGKLPFESNSLAELLSRVQRGDFAMPRTILPSLPQPLEAICLKAMSREPSQRYASALDMAADLDHWLADEPVKAHREPLSARVSRFVRHHRAWTMSGAAALAVIAVIATVSAFWINGQKQVITKQERAATQMADRNATLAEQEKSARQKADLNAAATLRLTKLAERHLYFAHMNLAQSAWESPAVNQTVHLLELYRPLKLARTESEVTSRDPSLALRASLPHLTQTEELGSRDDLRGFEWFYWDHCCHSELLTLKGHSDGVTSVAVSPDGRRIASASWDRTVKVWDAITSQELLTLKGHTASISCVVFSPDGQRLASVSLDQTGKVWDAATGQELLALKGHSGKLWSVAFSPDGQRLASGSSDGTIKWWDAVTGQELSTQKGHKSDVMSVAFSLDGKQLASAGWDHTVKVWDAVTGQETLI
jgi:type II secretory pathway pseudopilin PulG